MEEHSVPGSMVDRSAVNRSVPRGSRPLIRIPRYNFGTIKEREFRWAFVQAAPAKAFSVFPNLLCKQGAAGSSPATSTNYIFFNEIASMFSQLPPGTQAGGLGLESAHLHHYYILPRYDLRCIFDHRLLDISRSIKS